ncbi:HD domain-containing protein [Desulfonatronovibrio hydrogenovorans]|uniref:HD domain-containing protein n=1 Tax=Desulfonatronovibrio hydrogenovorans TaxID=53245 RepID=UPI00048D2183|nr:HD domain-containing protein [Desulfonatronovibrio hydrogenovorans]
MGIQLPSVRKGLLQLIFSGSFMKRWNDKLRPVELAEVDKQAHKMIAAFALFVLNSKGLHREEQIKLAEDIILGGIFDYLYRLVITDIKPPVFYQIKSNPDHYRQLTKWVLEQLQPRVQPLGGEFWDRLRSYLEKPDHPDLAGRILSGAHIFASSWEFSLIKGINPGDDELKEIEDNFAALLQEHNDLEGMQDLIQGSNSGLGGFLNLCGRLRFQKRWSQTPRIPETSVLGHMFIVACFAYFFSLSIQACPLRRQNNFFAGLLHDLPELLTRDIISPVKQSVRRIGDLIKEYENQELEQRVFTLLSDPAYSDLTGRLRYYLGADGTSEFDNTIVQGGRAIRVSWADLQTRYNQDCFDPKDGYLLKVCDNLAAFIEAYTATRNGITNEQLQHAQWKIRNMYQHESLLEGVHIGALLADFD